MKVARDVLGRLVGGSRVRVLVVIDDTDAEHPQANLLLVTKSKMGPTLDVETIHNLERAGRTGPGQSAKWEFLAADREPIVVIPAGCACGAGLLAYGDPTPGEARHVVPMPGWLMPGWLEAEPV